jgi:hypothetical protein
MPRLLLKFAFLIALALTATSLAAHALGSIQPLDPILRGFTEDCEEQPQPCWYGIMPGQTNVVIAQNQLESKGYKLYHAESRILYFSNRIDGISKAETCSNIRLSFERNSQTLSTITLIGCDGIILGDLWHIGFPQKIMQPLDVYIKLNEYYTAITDQHEFVDTSYIWTAWSPNTKIYGLDIGSSAKTVNLAIDLVGHNWHGFVPYWRYCQLEPNFGDCK